MRRQGAYGCAASCPIYGGHGKAGSVSVSELGGRATWRGECLGADEERERERWWAGAASSAGCRTARATDLTKTAVAGR